MAAARLLTAGEIAAGRRVLGDAVGYDRVRVHCGKYIFFQPARVAMAPDGEIYFPPVVYRDDFSTMVGDAAWIVHELAHVWQFQSGVNLILRAPFSRRYDYGPVTPRLRFAALNIEQQASAVADAFLVAHGCEPRHGTGTLVQYRALLPFAPVP